MLVYGLVSADAVSQRAYFRSVSLTKILIIINYQLIYTLLITAKQSQGVEHANTVRESHISLGQQSFSKQNNRRADMRLTPNLSSLWQA